MLYLLLLNAILCKIPTSIPATAGNLPGDGQSDSIGMYDGNEEFNIFPPFLPFFILLSLAAVRQPLHLPGKLPLGPRCAQPSRPPTSLQGFFRTKFRHSGIWSMEDALAGLWMMVGVKVR